MKSNNIIQGLILLCIVLIIIYLNILLVRKNDKKNKHKKHDILDYFIHYSTSIGTISFIILLIYIIENKNNKSMFQFNNIKLDRNNITIGCYNFIVIGLFSIIYYYISNLSDKNHFKFNGKPIRLTMLESIYVSLVTQTTVGYGHITYNSYIVKVLNIIQMISILLNITFIQF